eukprot:5591911-Amphidinium_carterae.5
MKRSDEGRLTEDVYLWDTVNRNYWETPGKEFSDRPTVVIADSCLHFTSSCKDERIASERSSAEKSSSRERRNQGDSLD